MKNSIITFFLVIGSLLLVQAAPRPSMKEAVTKASHQEMLTQSIAKSYLCVVLGINEKKHAQLLKENIQLFDNSLKTLQGMLYNRAIKDQFLQVEALWKQYKFICEGAYNKGNALLILELNTGIWQVCHSAVLLLQQHAFNNNNVYHNDLPILPVIIASAQQKALMQRMILYTLAKKYDFGNPSFNEEKYRLAAITFTEKKEQLSSLHEMKMNWSTFEQKLTQLVQATTTEEQVAAVLSPLLALIEEPLPIED